LYVKQFVTTAPAATAPDKPVLSHPLPVAGAVALIQIPLLLPSPMLQDPAAIAAVTVAVVKEISFNVD
jgi:hypothetical protein